MRPLFIIALFRQISTYIFDKGCSFLWISFKKTVKNFRPLTIKRRIRYILLKKEGKMKAKWAADFFQMPAQRVWAFGISPTCDDSGFTFQYDKMEEVWNCN